MSPHRVLALAVVPCCCLVALISCDGGTGSGVIDVSEDDPEMNAAMEQARSTISQFLDRREETGPAAFTGLLKVYFEEEASAGEHMWVDLTEADGDSYKGILLSQPRDMKSLSEGDDVSFTTSDISDWMYVKEGKAVGAYTVQLLRSRMTDEERAAHDAGYPFSYD